MKINFTSWKFLAIALFFSSALAAQIAGDYRSVTSGNWNTVANWQTYNGASWVAASTFPRYTDGVITIQNATNITFNISDTVDQVVVAAGDTLTVNNSAN